MYDFNFISNCNAGYCELVTELVDVDSNTLERVFNYYLVFNHNIYIPITYDVFNTLLDRFYFLNEQELSDGT